MREGVISSTLYVYALYVLCVVRVWCVVCGVWYVYIYAYRVLRTSTRQIVYMQGTP